MGLLQQRTRSCAIMNSSWHRTQAWPTNKCHICHRHISSPIKPHPWLNAPRVQTQLLKTAAEDITWGLDEDEDDAAFFLPSRRARSQRPAPSYTEQTFNQPDLQTIPWIRRQKQKRKKKLVDLQAQVKELQSKVEVAERRGEAAKARVLKRAVAQKLRSQWQVKNSLRVDSSKVAVNVQQLCQVLDIPLDKGLRMAERCDRLVMTSPAKIRERVELLAAAVGGSYQDALQLAIIRPSLLLYSPNTIQRNIAQLTQRLNIPRGSPLLQMLTQRPELLTSNPTSVATKITELAALLSVSESRVRNVVVSCPRLLRSSGAALQSKFNRLKKLLAIPASTLSELLLREPNMLVMGSATMQRKLQALLFKFAMFEDEVVDMLLADPSILMSDDLTSYEMAAMMASQPDLTTGDTCSSPPALLPYSPPSTSGLPALSLSSPIQKPAPKRTTLVDPITLLCRVLGVTTDRGVLLLAAHGEVLGPRSAGRLRGEVTQLASILGVVYEDAAAMVCSQPGLLAWSAAQQPAPLTSSSAEESAPEEADDTVGEGELQQTLTQLEDLLDVDESSLRRLFTLAPDLLTEPRTVIASRLKSLQEALGVSPSRATQVAIKAPQLLQDPTSLGAASKMGVLQDILGISKSQASELVCREPELLIVSPSEMRQRFQALAARFGLFQDDAIDVVMADPSILLRLTDEQFEF